MCVLQFSTAPQRVMLPSLTRTTQPLDALEFAASSPSWVFFSLAFDTTIRIKMI